MCAFKPHGMIKPFVRHTHHSQYAFPYYAQKLAYKSHLACTGPFTHVRPNIQILSLLHASLCYKQGLLCFVVYSCPHMPPPEELLSSLCGDYKGKQTELIFDTIHTPC